MQYDASFLSNESALRLMLPLHVALAPPGATLPTLARIAYGLAPDALLTVPLEALSGPATEVWTTSQDIKSFAHENVRAHYTKTALIMAGRVQAPGETSFEAQVTQLYDRMLDSAQALGFPHVLRLWNYLPHITAPSLGMDFYQRFNRARAAALEGRLSQWPAATAVGTYGQDICVYLLAASTPGTALENPRQVSAYLYPPQYGPKSPLFARAVLKHWNGVTHLYLSGTASVLGHASRHAGDVLAQLDESLQNIEALLAANVHQTGPLSLRDLTTIKVYLAAADDAAAIRERLAVAFPGQEPLLLHADLCRKELLVELEAVVLCPNAPAVLRAPQNVPAHG